MMRRQVLLPAGLVFAYAVVVSRLPLLNSLGYEYSAAIALVLPIVPGLFLLRAFAPGGAGGRTALLQSAASLAAALVVGYLNSFFVKNCSPGDGLAWFFLLPCAGMAWVASLAYFCAASFPKRVRWYAVILAAVLVHPLYLGYFTPRIDSYNFVYGYFPGFTYDEDLRLTSTLGVWRVITAVCAIALAAAGTVMQSRKSGRNAAAGGTVVVLSVAALAVAWFFRTDIGIETTASSLRRALGSEVTTRHFRIYYDSTSIPADEVKWVAAEHEFRFWQVSRFLGADTNRVIESYIHPDDDAKRRLIGAGNTDIAKPWRGEIYLDAASWRLTLKHELAHALASEFGMPVIRANVNIGLTEGLAMAASPSFGNRTLREYAASMIRFGIVDDPAALIRPAGFAFQSSTVSYVLMGAFSEHLIARYGIAPFRTWYGGGSPKEAYGKDADALVGEWKRSLDSVRVPEEWRAHTDYYFRRGSIFARECARAVANLNADGARALAKKDYPDALAAYSSGLDASWNASSFAGLARTLLGSGDVAGTIDLFEAEQGDSARRGSLAGLKFIYGDALLMRGNYNAARHVYREIRALDLSPGSNEAAALRLVVTETPDLRDLLAPWIAGEMEDSVALERLSGLTSVNNPALLAYVRGRLYLGRKDYESAARATAEYFTPFPYPELNGALSDIAAAAFFRLGDFMMSRVFYERTLEYDPGAGLLLRTRDRSERCLWLEREWGGPLLTGASR
jgi:tetratricopeptide (TPR) repeat protein